MKYPWKTEAVNHLDNGFDVKNTQAGQRRPYGDSYYEFTVKSDKPYEEVKKYCTQTVRKCDLTTGNYLADERAGVEDFGDHFRSHYEFKMIKEGEYFYRVTSPSTH